VLAGARSACFFARKLLLGVRNGMLEAAPGKVCHLSRTAASHNVCECVTDVGQVSGREVQRMKQGNFTFVLHTHLP
jgi:hypothetical protein